MGQKSLTQTWWFLFNVRSQFKIGAVKQESGCGGNPCRVCGFVVFSELFNHRTKKCLNPHRCMVFYIQTYFKHVRGAKIYLR